MSGRASGGGVKRQREDAEEEDAPASLESDTTLLSLHSEPLMLLVLVKAHFETLVWLQLCSPQGVALFSFVRLPPRLSRPFAGAAVYDMSLTHAERLCAVGCGFKGRLVRLLSLGFGRHFEPQRNRRACHQMMLSNARRVASKSMAAVRDEAAKVAEELCSSGQCAAAVVPLQRAIDLGDSTSRALKAWLLIGGREGVAKDEERGFELAEEGAHLGCHHCQGVVAYCLWGGFCGWGVFSGPGYGCERDPVRSLELARESSGRGSRYGQFTLGWLHRVGAGGLGQDDAQALALHRLAATQGLDKAQLSLGGWYHNGFGVAQDYAEALRLYQLAAAQGYPHALYMVANCHERGHGVAAADVAAAICWYRRAQAAGNTAAARELQRLGA
jgi:TPR repeat protein